MHPRPRLAWLALAYAATCLGWSRFGGAAAPGHELAAALFPLPLIAGATALFHLASRRSRVSAELRPAMRLLAATGAVLVIGCLVAATQLLVAGRLPTGSPADVVFLIAYPLNLAAFLVLPGGARMDRWKALCDAGMVLSGAGVALWYFVLRAAVPPTADPMAVMLALAYPLGDLLLLVGLVSVGMRQPLPGTRAAVRWLAFAAVLMVATDLAATLLIVRTGHRSTLGLDALGLACGVVRLVAAERFFQGPLPETMPSAGRALLMLRLRSLLPFTAAGATYALLLVIALRGWVAPLSGLAIGAIAVSVFLGARQLLDVRRDAAVLAEAAVRASEARFRSLVQHSSDLIFQLDADGIVTFASSSAARVIGYEPDAVVGSPLAALAHADDAGKVTGFVQTAVRLPGVTKAAEWRFRRPDGGVVEVEAVASNLLADPNVRGVVLNVRDVRERKALLDQLAHQAFHDPLTGLANRVLFYDRVNHALALAQREGPEVTVLFLDLDDFKQVNDTLGHAEGDRLLTMIAMRLRACARATDTVARLGGDEFAVLVTDERADVGCAHLVGRIHEQMAWPFGLGGADVRVGASIGIASARGGTVDDILRHADVAMYAAKRTGKGLHRAFEPAMLDG